MTAELSENIEQLQNEAYLIRKNDEEGIHKSNSGFQGYHSKDIMDLNNLQGTNQLIKQIINAINIILLKENMLIVFPAWVPHAVEIIYLMRKG